MSTESWGPFTQAVDTDVRWHIQWHGTSTSVIIIPWASTPNTNIRSHDPGMYQPPQGPPQLVTSVVMGSSASSSPQFYFWGLG